MHHAIATQLISEREEKKCNCTSMLAKKSVWFPTWSKLYEHTRHEFINLITYNKRSSMQSYQWKLLMIIGITWVTIIASIQSKVLRFVYPKLPKVAKFSSSTIVHTYFLWRNWIGDQKYCKLSQAEFGHVLLLVLSCCWVLPSADPRRPDCCDEK